MISGGGRSLQNLIDLIDAGKLNARIAVVISSLSKVAGVERARAAGLAVEIIRRKDFADPDAFSDAIVNALESHGVELAVQAGWTCLWRMPERWYGRVMNIHPALLPKYGGKGYFGHHVHEAVLKAGEKESGCTVHFANNEYDAGPIILQRVIDVRPDDTPDTLAARVFEQECIAYPIAIRLFAEGRLRIQGNFVEVVVSKPDKSE
jgi:formyltetrahydrofolate-dependent phosphoribosylglycinamide formyltransferase